MSSITNVGILQKLYNLNCSGFNLYSVDAQCAKMIGTLAGFVLNYIVVSSQVGDLDINVTRIMMKIIWTILMIFVF